MEFKITIINKYKTLDNVVWYTDTNGIRYSKEDIVYVIKNKKMPLDKLFILRFRESTVIINMTIDRNGNIRSTDRRINVINIGRVKTISLVIEDSNSGMQFYKTILEIAFPKIIFEAKTANGFRGIANIIHSGYKCDIVIMDKKMDSICIMDLIDDIKNEMLDIGTHLYMPTSIEEIFLSNLKLQIYKPSKLKKQIENYFNTGLNYYVAHSRVGYEIGGVSIPNLEKLLNSELSRISAIRYNKKQLSGCFILKCCDNTNNLGEFSCAQYTINNKSMNFINYSILGGLLNIVLDIIGDKQKYLTNWSKESLMELYI